MECAQDKEDASNVAKSIPADTVLLYKQDGMNKHAASNPEATDKRTTEGVGQS